MAKFPMDLSKFQKISATDKKTTLKHKDGHFMVIAHGALKPEMRQALDGLPFAKGGKVKKMADGGTVPEPDPKKAKEMQDGATQSGWQPEKWTKNLKEGLGFKNGGEIPEPEAMRVEQAATTAQQGPPKPRPDDVKSDPMRYLNSLHGEYKDAAEHPKHVTDDGEGYAKGGKIQRAKIFGERGDPGKNSAKGKAQMIALIKTAAKRYGLEVTPSKGKIEEDGSRRDFDPKQVGGKLKPDWRSNEMESQMNPQAISHEMAHLEISPEGKRLPTLQEEMDEGYADVASKFGGRQKQTQGEIQPMAMENPLRRRAGVPAFARPQYNDPTMGKGKEPITEESPERVALDTGEKYAVRLQDPETGEMYDLIGLAKNASPPNLERLQAVDEGSMKFNKAKGWHKTSTPDALVNLRGRGKGEEATARAKEMGIQKGKKPSRLYAEGDLVEPETGMPENQLPTEPAMEPQAPTAQPDAYEAPGAAMPAPGMPQPAPTQAAMEPQAPMSSPTGQRAQQLDFTKGATDAAYDPTQQLAPRSISQQMRADHDALAQDLALGHVTPKTYKDLYANQDTLGKIGTMFGLLAGGLGSGLTGQPNAMLKMMDKAIERDLDAQKTSATNRQNFYKIRMQKYLNDAQIRESGARAKKDELSNQATEWGLQKAGVIRGKGGKLMLSPAAERQVRAEAKGDMFATAAHDLETKLAGMSPSSPMYAPMVSALQEIKRNIASQNEAGYADAEKARQAEEDAHDPIAKITGIPRSKVPLPEVSTLLSDDADQKIMGLSAAAASSPMYKETFGPLLEQYNAAKQTDAVLKDLPATFQDLARLRNWSQRIIQPLAGALPGVAGLAGAALASESNPMGGAYMGEGIGAGAAQAVKALSGTEQNRLYDAAVSKLGGIIMGAKIPNLGHEEAMRWAHQYAPVAGDSQQAVDWKLTQLADKIKMSAPRGLLQAHGFMR